ncbi:MAG: NADPH-dependent FMN reductase [Pigmentiphaga sp.]
MSLSINCSTQAPKAPPSLRAADRRPLRPKVLLLGGTLVPNSTTEKALRIVAAEIEKRDAQVTVFTGPELDLPFYCHGSDRSRNALRLVEAMRAADSLVIGSPAYHGGVSGLIKNALDYAEDLRTDDRAYFTGRAVGCIGLGGGWQGAIAALNALRSTVHALRGWPTPFGVAINASLRPFDNDGVCTDLKLSAELVTLAEQVTSFPAFQLR